MTILAGIDIETTGLKQEDGHRIIEICMITYDTNLGNTPTDKFSRRIDPRRSIDAKAQLIHGISLGQLVGKPMFKDIAHEIGEFLSDVDIIIAHNCIPGESEILTRDGWVRIDKLNGESEVMQWCPRTQQMNFVVPVAKVKSHSDSLIKWSGQHHSGAYTPNHKMYYSTPNVKSWRAAHVSDVAGMSQNNCYIPTGGFYEPPACRELRIDNTEVRLMEAIRADGSMQRNTDAVRWKFKKQRKIERIKWILDELKVDYSESAKNGITIIRTYSCDVTKRIKDVIGNDKIYGSNLYNLSVANKQILLDEIKHWDGAEATSKLGTIHFSTVDERTVDTVQTVASMCGMSVTYKKVGDCRVGSYREGGKAKDLFLVTIRKRERVKLIHKPNIVEHNDSVYCLTVDSGAFLMRYEGKVCVTGNCDFDGTFLAAELLRVGEDIPDVKSFCTMTNARWATATGKKPSLRELCFACGIEYDTSKAHAALYDVLRAMDCFFYARERGFYEQFDELI